MYLAKLLKCIKQNSRLFQTPEINFIVGLTKTQIKELKREALEKSLMVEHKREFTLTELGEKYLQETPIISWCNNTTLKRPEINLEYLKLEKAPPTLTRAIRQLARHLLEGEELKENSTEYYLIKELLCEKSNCKGVKEEIAQEVLKDGKQKLTCLFEKFSTPPYGLTKSIIGVLLLDVLNKNKDILAIYENGQFQLKLNQLMFDRMLYCPQNFELQKTVLEDMPILENVSEIVLPVKSKNILDLTKGLIHFIRNLDKYTLNTEELSRKTIRFRNAIMNAKDPISLFYRDIPKILDDKILCQCGEDFVKEFDNAIEELQTATIKMIKNLYIFALSAFNSKNRKELTQRFEAIKEYIGDSELKILYNNIKETSSTDALWIERIATFINKSRVPKDWSDEDVADFKVKVKELALKFLAIEAIVDNDICEERLDKTFKILLNKVLNLSKSQQNILMRRVVNG